MILESLCECRVCKAALCFFLSRTTEITPHKPAKDGTNSAKYPHHSQYDKLNGCSPNLGK